MPMTHDEIIELMQETITEREEAIKARPSSKREFELTLISSGMNIVQAENDEQALYWA